MSWWALDTRPREVPYRGSGEIRAFVLYRGLLHSYDRAVPAGRPMAIS